MLLSYLGFSKQLEVLIIIIFGICVFAFDTSILHVQKDLEELWSYEFDPKFHKNRVDVYLKYIITGVVLIRTLTVHLFLALYVVMLWPAMFADRPNLILPWLVVGSVRSVLVNFVTLITGSIVCVILKEYHSICLDFILSQIIQHGPAVYAWLTVLGYYQDLRMYCEQKQRNKSEDFHIVSNRRRSRNVDVPELCFSEKFLDKTLLKRYSSDFTLESLNNEDDNVNEVVAKPSKSVDSFFKPKSQVKDQFANNEREVNAEATNNEEKCLFRKAMTMFNLTYEDISKLRTENSRGCLDNNENVDERIISSELLNANEKMEEETCDILKNPTCSSPVKVTTMDTNNGCQCTFDDT